MIEAFGARRPECGGTRMSHDLAPAPGARSVGGARQGGDRPPSGERGCCRLLGTCCSAWPALSVGAGGTDARARPLEAHPRFKVCGRWAPRPGFTSCLTPEFMVSDNASARPRPSPRWPLSPFTRPTRLRPSGLAPRSQRTGPGRVLQPRGSAASGAGAGGPSPAHGLREPLWGREEGSPGTECRPRELEFPRNPALPCSHGGLQAVEALSTRLLA